MTADIEIDGVIVAVEDGVEWLYLAHPAFNGSTRIPNDPDVLASHLARGWVGADPPDRGAPVIPDPNAGPVDDADAWIDMVHPESGGTQRLPNNTDALTGARDAGWVTAAEATAVELEGLTVAEVLEAVGDDPEKAAAALAAERDGKNRSSLIRALEAIAEDASTITAEPHDEEN
jgi:hypothetical protein